MLANDLEWLERLPEGPMPDRLVAMQFFQRAIYASLLEQAGAADGGMVAHLSVELTSNTFYRPAMRLLWPLLSSKQQLEVQQWFFCLSAHMDEQPRPEPASSSTGPEPDRLLCAGKRWRRWRFRRPPTRPRPRRRKRHRPGPAPLPAVPAEPGLLSFLSFLLVSGSCCEYLYSSLTRVVVGCLLYWLRRSSESPARCLPPGGLRRTISEADAAAAGDGTATSRHHALPSFDDLGFYQEPLPRQ